MSLIPNFFSLAPGDRPLARARFSALALRLAQLEDSAAMAGELQPTMRAWIEALRHAGSTDDLPAVWRRQLAAEPSSAALLAPPGAYQILQAQGRHLPDPDFLTGAEMLERARRYLRAQAAAAALAPRAGALAAELCGPVRSLFSAGRHAENRVNFDDLERSLATFLGVWMDAVRMEGPEPAHLVALQAFVQHVTVVHEAPEGFWGLLLHEIAALPALEPFDGEGLSQVLLAALTRFDLLRQLAEIWGSTEAQRAPAAVALRTLLELHLLVSCAPQSTAARTLAGARPAAFARLASSTATAFDEARGPLRDRLAQESEPAAAWLAALGWVERVAALPETLRLQRPHWEHQLTTALQDEPDYRRLVELGVDLIEVSAELHTTALRPETANALWRRYTIADLGADPAARPWQQAAALGQALAGLDAPAGAIADFRQLAATVEHLRAWPIGSSRQILRVTWTPDITRFPAEETRARHRSFAEVLVTRLCIEHRLAGPAPASAALVRWMRDHDTVPPCWADTVHAIKPKLTAPLAGAAEELTRQLPRISAGLLLLREHAVLGATAAAHSCAELPGYRASLGARDEAACARENTLVLRHLGQLMLSDPVQAGRQLADWWNRIYAPYATRRSAETIDVGFEGLQASLLSHCEHAEFEVALPALHTFYQVAHGMQPSPLLLFTEGNDQRLRPEFAQRVRGIATAANALRPALELRLTALAGPAITADILAWFDRARDELSVASHPEAALARLRPSLTALLGRHASATVAQAFILLAAETTRHPPTSRLDLSWRAWGSLALLGLEAIEQEALARALLPAAPPPGRPTRASAAPFGDAHELGAMNAFLARQLRTHSAPLAVLNTSRYLVECIAPALHRPTAGWRTLFSAWLETSRARCPAGSQELLREIAAHLDALAPRLSRVHGICARSFRAGLPLFAPDHETESAARVALSLALLYDDNDISGRFPRQQLCALGWRHGLTSSLQLVAMHHRLVAHADRLFDFLEGDDFYWLHDQLVFASHAAQAALTPPPAAPEEIVRTAISLATPREPRRTINPFKLLTAPRPTALPGEVARAAAAAALAGLRGDIAPVRLAAILAQIRHAVPSPLAAACADAQRTLYAALEGQPGCAGLIATAKALDGSLQLEPTPAA